MVQSIGKGGGLAREALLAAMKAQAKNAERVREGASSLESIAAGGTSESSGVTESDFARAVQSQIEGIDDQIKGVDELPQDLLNGKIDNIHEIAVRVKEAEFRFRFAMEIRNKLLDAYREVMRMNV
ncbi:MAG TPA: hypothetical protein ENJ09_00255 [Planctomycetes bacterium]|nr:hypothetical protein [Planctomycetota bacterium]